MKHLLTVEKLAPVRERVADRIRDAIVGMHFQPGALLVERELCEATTASRASVREALRVLESEGLVVSEPGRGTRVAELTLDEALHVYEVRGALEALAGRLFAQRATQEQIEALARAVEHIDHGTAETGAMLRAKSEFYEILFEGSGNPELRQMLDGLLRRATLVRVTSLSVPGRPAQAAREMQGILAAARARDADETARRCAAHVHAAAETALGDAARRLDSTGK